MPAPRSLPLLPALVALAVSALPSAAQAVASGAGAPPGRVADPWHGLRGERLRLVAPRSEPSSPSPLQGRLLASRGDTLLLAPDSGRPTVEFVVSPGTEVRRWRRQSRRWEGLALGVALGGVAGGVIANARYRDPEPVECGADANLYGLECVSVSIGSAIAAEVERGVLVVTGVAAGAALGGLLGHFIGKRIVREGWVPVDGLRLSGGPARAGGVGVTLELRHR